MIKPDGVLDGDHGETVAVWFGVGHGQSDYPDPIKATQPCELLRDQLVSYKDEAASFQKLELKVAREITPYMHQQKALTAWVKARRQGVVVLPTGSGKTLVAQLVHAVHAAQRADLRADHRPAAPVVLGPDGGLSGREYWSVRRPLNSGG